MQKNCAREGDTLRLTAEPPAPGRDIRVRGSDFSEHALLAARGARMTPAAIALAIMGGHGTVPVHRRTRIALISTADEQNGRASCRESVCQYVSISVVAVSLKKKIKNT